MNTTQHIQPDFDKGAIGYMLRITGERLICPWSFPVVTSAALAEELRDMLAMELTGCNVGIIHAGLFSGEIEQAEELTERIKARVIKARVTESPGYEFLRGIGWHPAKRLAQADYDAAELRRVEAGITSF
jgi:hypothetical protein